MLSAMNLLILALLVLALYAALEPQHRRAKNRPPTRLGSDVASDRDLARLAADLHAAADQSEVKSARPSSRRPPHLTNLRRQPNQQLPTVLS